MEAATWQCANCDTLVEKATTDRCPTCGHVYFYPVATSVTDSVGSGTVRVEEFDLETVLTDEEDEEDKA